MSTPIMKFDRFIAIVAILNADKLRNGEPVELRVVSPAEGKSIGEVYVFSAEFQNQGGSFVGILGGGDWAEVMPMSQTACLYGTEQILDQDDSVRCRDVLSEQEALIGPSADHFRGLVGQGLQ